MLGQFIEEVSRPGSSLGQPPRQPITIMRPYTLPRSGIEVIAPDPLPVSGQVYQRMYLRERPNGTLVSETIAHEPPDEGGFAESVGNTPLEQYLEENQRPLYLRHTRQIALQENQETPAPENRLPPLQPPPEITNPDFVRNFLLTQGIIPEGGGMGDTF